MDSSLQLQAMVEPNQQGEGRGDKGIIFMLEVRLQQCRPALVRRAYAFGARRHRNPPVCIRIDRLQPLLVLTVVRQMVAFVRYSPASVLSPLMHCSSHALLMHKRNCNLHFLVVKECQFTSSRFCERFFHLILHLGARFRMGSGSMG